MTDTGFYSIVTEGNFFYVSNTYRNSVSRISKTGLMVTEFLIVDKPIALAVNSRTLFVQSVNFIHIYRLDVNYNTTNVISLPFSSSGIFPSIVYKEDERLLYISNYSAGTITTLNDNGVFSTAYTGLVGISGLCVAANVLYFSNYINNRISFCIQGTVQNYMEMNKPKWLTYDSGNFYICYGTKQESYGIGLNIYGTPNYTNIFTAYQSDQIPTTVASIEKRVYYTISNSNIVYRDNIIFSTAIFGGINSYNAVGITQSVITTNLNCVTNPAYNGLRNLRTVGSNPNNPIPPVTTRVGRLSGNNIPFNVGIGSSYDSYKMRRKAEVLKYKDSTNNPGVTLSNKELFSNIVKYGGAYKFSKARLTQLLKENNGKLPCDIGVNNGNPITITPPTNSGIIDPNFEGYYLNPYLTYYPSL